MITRASFRNFKSLREVDVTFDSRLTVLVGPNGSGKSSILEGINYLARVAKPRDEAGGFDPRPLAERATVGTKPELLALEAAVAEPSGVENIVRIGHPPKQPPPPMLVGGHQGLAPQFRRLPVTGPSQWHSQPPPELVAVYPPAVLLRLDTDKLAAPSVTNGVPPRMQPTGHGLASALAYLALNQPEQFHGIVAELKEIIPTVRRLRFDKVQGNGFGDVILFDFAGAAGVRASFASTGTLIALGVLTAILGPERPGLVLLDDLDHALHPKAQLELVAVLRRLLGLFPDLQIIATSHSPYILDRLGWDEVLVTTLSDDGATVCKPLSEHPDYGRWKDAMSPGEFWSHAGEEWVAKARRKEPAAAAP
ncbi:MAG: AAA family ATPase [Gemmataceae bacterium]|nr:AAA family ATPase [Gemmataceae bacterium]